MFSVFSEIVTEIEICEQWEKSNSNQEDLKTNHIKLLKMEM